MGILLFDSETHSAEFSLNGVCIELHRVTPGVAREWLACNTHNRTLKETGLSKLVTSMERGDWLFNGDPIRFDETGTLIDGQHRLHACVQAEMPIDVLVVSGLPATAQDTVDTGIQRKLADSLRLRGETNSNELAAAINFLWRYENGRVRENSSVAPSMQQALAFVDQRPRLRSSVNATAHRAWGSKRAAAVAHYLVAALSQQDSEAFFEGVFTGVNLGSHDSRLRLRERITQLSRDRETNRSPAHVLALYLKAWNDFVTGRECKTLRWRVGGAAPETFPEPIDPERI